MNKKPTDSLAIIEDCLERIYQSRRANLLNKSRKFKEKQARKAFDRPSGYTQSENASFEKKEDYGDQEVLDELEIKYSAPPVSSVPYMKERSKIAQQYEDQDAEALVLFRTFCDDLTVLIEESPMRLSEDDFRADNCDIFIKKYFTGHFDKMMGTRLLSKIRKHVTHIIEEFSSENNSSHILNLMKNALADCEGASIRSKSSLDRDTTSNNNSSNRPAPTANETTSGIALDSDKGSKGGVNLQKQSNNNSSASTGVVVPLKSALKAAPVPMPRQTEEKHPPDSATNAQAHSAADRQKSDKQRMKAQYEQLMAMKKKVENHPDDEAVSQYSALHADIQSVIDSIQKNQPVK